MLKRNLIHLCLLLLLSACARVLSEPPRATLVIAPDRSAMASAVPPMPTTMPAADWLNSTLAPTQPGLLLAIYTPESSQPSGYCMMNLSTKNCHILYHTDIQSDVGSFRTAPNGNWFITTLWNNAAKGYDLYALRTDSTTWQQLTNDRASEFIQDWAETSDKILYLRNDPNDAAHAEKFRLYEMALSGFNSTPLIPEADVHMARWLSGETRVLFGGEYRGQSGIFIWETATQTITQLAVTRKGVFSLARDKTRLLYETNQDEIHLLDLQTAQTLPILPTGAFQRAGLWLANDSIALLHSARITDGGVQPRLYVWNAISNAIVEPQWSENKTFLDLAVSPDGKTVLLSLENPQGEQAADFETYWLWDTETDTLTALQGLPQGMLIASAFWGNTAQPAAEHIPQMLP